MGVGPHLKLAHKCDVRVVHDDAARAAVPQRAVIAALQSMKADCLQQRAPRRWVHALQRPRYLPHLPCLRFSLLLKTPRPAACTHWPVLLTSHSKALFAWPLQRT